MIEESPIEQDARLPDGVKEAKKVCKFSGTVCKECPFPLDENGNCPRDGFSSYIKYFRNKAILYDHKVRRKKKEWLAERYGISLAMVGKIILGRTDANKV